MCTKTSKTPLLLIGGVCFVIVLVGITGVTLINNLNLSNIIKLNEKVASDSMSAHDTELHDINYANNHPKNIYKFDEFSAPYALAVASYTQHTVSMSSSPHSSVAAAAATTTATAKAAAAVSASVAPQNVYTKSHTRSPSPTTPTPPAGGTVIGQPAVALVDAEANSGNAAVDPIIEVRSQAANGRQQGLFTTLNWLKQNGKLQSRDATATSTNSNANTNTDTAAIVGTNADVDTSSTLVNNPQINTVQSSASIVLTAAASSSTPSNVSSFSDAGPLQMSTNTSSPSAVTAASSSVSESGSMPSAGVDIVAKLMLPLILNGSARITPGSDNENENEEHSFAADTVWGFPRDNRTTFSGTHQSSVSPTQTGRVLVPPSGGKGVDKEKRDRVVKVSFCTFTQPLFLHHYLCK
ncbi:serine-rich adhesin for platelets-like isoform X2 [Anastrepha ludens]|uniref:serine-rich adhesin for platelets-like isoform X2 n=1 Tax=Anastrepha ludens TaxID=28586 RepID=UPI0023AF652D|nr:serine-rich adhesin for platelets-like isoform X2 [Anastrepha ludens]